MKDIKRLTPEQISLDTRPADRPAAEAAVKQMYAIAGLDRPRVVWCSSPLAVILTATILREKKFQSRIRARVRAGFRGSVWDSVRDSIRYSERVDASNCSNWNAVTDSIRDSYRKSLPDWGSIRKWDSVQDIVQDSIRNIVLNSVRESARVIVGSTIWSNMLRKSIQDSMYESDKTFIWDYFLAYVWDSIKGIDDRYNSSRNWRNVSRNVEKNGMLYGQHEALTLKSQPDKISGLTALARSAGWALPYKHICFVSERHCIVRQDDNRHIHCENGPAIQYPDGWSIYAFHGERVPSWVIEQPEEITTDKIIVEEYVDVQRVMIERMGRDRFIAQSGATLLHEDKDHLGHPRNLWCVPIDALNIDTVFVEFQDSNLEPDGSRKTYFQRVDSELRPLLDDEEFGEPQEMTCHNAVASTFGLRGEDYHYQVGCQDVNDA